MQLKRRTSLIWKDRICSDLGHASVDEQLNAVDEAALVRGKEKGRSGDLFRCADTAQWGRSLLESNMFLVKRMQMYSKGPGV